MKHPFLPAHFIIIIFLLAGCSHSSENNQTENSPLNKPEKLYVLENGNFVKITSFSDLKKKEMLPWTVQERVPDFIVYKNNIIAAVNGYGIAAISSNENIEFEYIYNRDVYQYKTITKLYPYNDSVLCHFYFNSILNIKGIKNNGSANTMQYFYSGNPEPINIPFKKNNPDWEIISMIPCGENSFYLEWKREQDNNVNFRYSEVSFNEGTENIINRDMYRKQFDYADFRVENKKSRINEIVEIIIKELNISDNIHFIIEVPEPPFLIKYSRNGDSDNDTNEIKIIKNNNSFFALLNDNNKIIIIKNNNQIFSYELPELPLGIKFMEFIAADNLIAVSWEEIDFFNVGNSGIIILDIERLL